MADFRAYYCAGEAVRLGLDPYREHPLHECEHAVAAPGLSSLPAVVTVPTPYPGFTLGLFAGLSLLPFSIAFAVWTLGAVVALAAAIALCVRLTATPALAAAIVLGFPAAIVALPLGQITPLLLGALLACAELLERDRPWLAAATALVIGFDPRVGFPVAIALAGGHKRMRLPIVIAAVAYGLVTLLVTLGPDTFWEYVTLVLPAHALANLPEPSQLSVSNLAFTLGASREAAVSIGSAWYLAAITIGIVAGVRLRAKFGVRALVLVPAAFAVFGGTHTHLQQLALAIPVFLLVCSHARGRRRTVYVAATFIAAMPWFVLAPFPVLFIAVAVLAWIYAIAMRLGRGVTVVLSLGTFIALALLCVVVAVAHTADLYVEIDPISGNPLAEVAWSRFIDAVGLPVKLWYLLAKLPTYGAFAVLLSVLGARAIPVGELWRSFDRWRNAY